MKTEILEYRKKTAEALGLKEGMVNMGQYAGMKWVKYPNGANIAGGWQPDKDANQREMIEDWLIEQGLGIDCDRNRESAIYTIWRENPKGSDDIFAGEDKSKSKAFMKAFMEYYSATRRAAK